MKKALELACKYIADRVYPCPIGEISHYDPGCYNEEGDCEASEGNKDSCDCWQEYFEWEAEKEDLILKTKETTNAK